MINIKNITVKSILIFSISLAYVFWGTGYEIPVLNLPPSIIFIGLILITLIIIKDRPIPKKDSLILLTYFGVITIMSLVSLPTLMNSDRYYTDLVYLLEYDLKMLIGMLSIFAFSRLFTSEDDIKFFSLIVCITLSPLIYILFYRYIVLWGMPYMGVEFGSPEKIGKNSFAMAIVLISPYLIINFNKGLFYKATCIFALLALSLSLYGIDSRAMIITMLFQLLIFLYVSGRRKILGTISAVFFLGIIYAGISVENFLVKRNADEEVNMEMVINILGNSHRGRLTKYAIEGTIDSYFMGNGIATYKYKQAGIVSGLRGTASRTESHNDILTVIFEQGAIGFFVLTYFFYHRFSLTHKLYIKTRDPTVLATLISLYGIVVSMIFANFISSMVFWIIIGLNVAISNMTAKKYLME